MNGVPTCADPWLLQRVARQTWGFDGYITSDCAAVSNVVSPHHFVKTAAEAVAVTLRAGMDIACARYVGQHGMAALQQQLITESLVDERLSNLFRVRCIMTRWDSDGPHAHSSQRHPPSAFASPSPSPLQSPSQGPSPSPSQAVREPFH